MSERYHGFDAARAVALILGVILHASEYHWPEDVPRSLRAVSPDAIPFLFYYFIHVFRLGAFFSLAGFFARFLIVKRGVVGFAHNRLRRVALPLFGAWLFTFPILSYFKIWETLPGSRRKLEWESIIQTATATWRDIVSGTAFELGIPLAHLWFLYYLLVFYAITLAVIYLSCRLIFIHKWVDHTGRLCHSLMRSRRGFLLLGIPLVLSMSRMTDMTGLRPPAPGLRLDKSLVLAYAIFFASGWCIHCHQDLLTVLRKRAIPLSTTGLVTALIPLYLVATSREGLRVSVSVPARWLYVTSYALAMLLLSFGFLGIMLRAVSRHNKVVRYVSGASYWIYLAHLPLVKILVALVQPLLLHWSVSLLTVVAATMAMLLAGYQWLVRDRLLGRFVGGDQKRRPASS